MAYRLSVAGPDIPFDPAVAYSAAELIRQASWALVNHDDRVSHLKKCLTMPIAAGDAGASPFGRSDAAVPAADLQPGARARSVRPAHRSSEGRCCRRWPLSGVLSDVAEAPLASLDFGGHPGLLLLYAERLAANDRPAWRPVQRGPGWEYYELVIDERGRGESEQAGRLGHRRKRSSRWMTLSTACAAKSSSR